MNRSFARFTAGLVLGLVLGIGLAGMQEVGADSKRQEPPSSNVVTVPDPRTGKLVPMRQPDTLLVTPMDTGVSISLNPHQGYICLLAGLSADTSRAAMIKPIIDDKKPSRSYLKIDLINPVGKVRHVKLRW